MADINDQSSDTSSEVNWPLEHSPRREHDDRVIFENVADQYVKGVDVTAFFTILQDIKVDPNQDQIGLLRVGCTNIKQCLAYADVQFNPSTTVETTFHGTATFPASVLPSTDDEFYQFCYIKNKTKNFGSSIPFQLNCAPDDIDLLSNTPVRKTKGDGFIALADGENDDIIVVHSKGRLTEEKLRQENRNLLDTNRRLETEKDEYKVKFDVLELQSKEHSTKMLNEIQALTTSFKTALEQLEARKKLDEKLNNDYNQYRELSVQYKTESEQYADRCRMLEASYAQMSNESNQLRSQLAITSQLTKDQATQVIDLERRLMQANEQAKATNQRQEILEKQYNDLRLASETNKIQMELYVKEVAEKNDQIDELARANNSLQEELRSIKENQESVSLVLKNNQELSEQLQKELEQLREQHRLQNEKAQTEIEALKSQLNETESVQQAYMALKTSYKEIEKRFFKHQKGEIEAKRKVAAYQEIINELQSEVEELRNRLATGADEYKMLFRKYAALDQSIVPKVQLTNSRNNISLTNSHTEDNLLESVFDNPSASHEGNIENMRASIAHAFNNDEKEIEICPMCYLAFPKNMKLEAKTEHIEEHFH